MANQIPNAGNQGDVVKHAVLAAVVNSLCDVHGDKETDEPFIYVETHTSYPEYTLEKSRLDGWHNGIKELTQRIENDGGEWPEELEQYHETCFKENRNNVVQKYDRYPGSSGIAFRILKRKEIDFEMTLYDIDSTACLALGLYFPMWKKVKVRREDGLADVEGCGTASLVFIDPFVIDPNEIARILAIADGLTQRGIPFVIWTPRNTNTTRGAEGNYSVDFFEQTENYSRFRVRWKPFIVQGTKGCQLTMSKDLESVAKPVAEKICKLMGGWHFEP